MPLTKPCPGQFAEIVQEFYRDNPSRAMQQEFPCTACGQSVGLTVKKGGVVPAAHWPSVPKRQEAKRGSARYSREHAGALQPPRSS